jgi:hypothetical protein
MINKLKELYYEEIVDFNVGSWDGFDSERYDLELECRCGYDSEHQCDSGASAHIQ